MCGIAAAIGSVDAGVIDAVRRINACQRLRGPDADGEWASAPADALARGGAFLAFRRLAIIDLSPEANQPMLDPATGNAVVFNGEIYNFRELRRELGASGDGFRTDSDTEVLLRAYARWGADALGRLRGMFALVLWDAGRSRALVARDRLGIKPLYFARVARPGGPVLLVASTVRGLLAGGLVERRLDPASVRAYVWNGFVPGPATIVRGVRLLPGGCVLDVPAQGAEPIERRYWSIPRSPGSAGVEEVGSRLADAVAQHLVSDVPLGVFLSGGKDSSAVTALAARSAAGRVKTFTVTFDESAYDESAYARRVAAALGTEHHEARITEAAFGSRLDAALECLDQPTFDAINTYLVSRAVREAGITVALAGTGGDELFGGYRSFRDLPRAARWSRRLRWAPAPLLRAGAGVVSRAAARSLSPFPPQTRWGRLGDALTTRGSLVDLYQTAYALFTEDFARELASDGGAVRRGLTAARAADLDRQVEGRPILTAVSALELELFLGDRLLRDTDAASMEVSLEVRVPLLDHLVVEALFGLTDARRFEPVGEKRLLCELGLGDLPASMFERPKQGFELPMERWCRRGMRGRVGDVLTDRSACARAGVDARAAERLWRAYDAGAPGLYWSRVWALFVLLDWVRRHDAAA